MNNFLVILSLLGFMALNTYNTIRADAAEENTYRQLCLYSKFNTEDYKLDGKIIYCRSSNSNFSELTKLSDKELVK